MTNQSEQAMLDQPKEQVIERQFNNNCDYGYKQPKVNKFIRMAFESGFENGMNYQKYSNHAGQSQPGSKQWVSEDQIEAIASKVHDSWWDEKKSNGFHSPDDCQSENKLSYSRADWKNQDRFDDHFNAKFYKWCDKCHPDMYPYNQLSENVKDYDRTTVRTVLKAMNSTTTPKSDMVSKAEVIEILNKFETNSPEVGLALFDCITKIKDV